MLGNVIRPLEGIRNIFGEKKPSAEIVRKKIGLWKWTSINLASAFCWLLRVALLFVFGFLPQNCGKVLETSELHFDIL